MASVPVNPVTMATAMKIAVDAIDVDSGAITNTAVILAICTAIANEVNLHTHEVGYVGGGGGSGPLTAISTPPGNP